MCIRDREQTYREKLVTVFHELYHISPRFNGDIRRLGGHYHVHSHSQKQYDLQMEQFVDEYLAMKPPRELLAFLKKSFRTLLRQYSAVVGVQVPIPRRVPVDSAKSA